MTVKKDILSKNKEIKRFIKKNPKLNLNKVVN